MGILVESQDFFDPSLEFIKAKNGYENKRGSIYSARFGMWYPKTTWGDIVTFYAAWLDYTNPAKCYARLPPGLYSGQECQPGFSTAYVRALTSFTNSVPRQKASSSVIADKIAMNELYPWNEDFWGYGRRYAIELAADVNMPNKFELVIESIVEAISELPTTIKDAIKKADPRNFLPDPDPWLQLFKWGSIAGGLFLLYQYVLKPKKKTS